MLSRNLRLVVLTVIFLGFPLFVFAKNYPDGTLIRARGDSKVYLIQSNKRSWIKSLEDFKAKGFKWQDVKIVSKKEAEAIAVGEVISTPTPTSTPTPQANPNTPIPSSSTTASQPSPSSGGQAGFPAPSPSTTPAKINPNLPAPDYIRADWLISQMTANYARIGEKIIVRYSTKDADKLENFRLYEKKPGDKYFSRIAEFQKIVSNTCEAINISGEWMMTEAASNQCGYWAIQRIIPPGGRGTTAYLPAGVYSQGEYSYYVAGVDSNGLETPPSLEAKLNFLTTVGIFSPVDSQGVAEVYPTFKWSIAGGWPAGAITDYYLMLSDNPSAQSPTWAKFFKIPAGQSDQSFTYDGVGFNPAKRYKTYIYGHYRKSEYDPDYISIPLSIPEFWMKPSQTLSWWGFLKAVIFRFAF